MIFCYNIGIINKLFMKKLLILLLFFALVFVGGVKKSQAAKFAPGSLLVQANLESATVYYIGDDGKKYIFPDAKTYFTWYRDFDKVKKVSLVELDQYPDGGIVPYRAGIRLITHQNTAKVYAVEPGGIIRWIKNESIAKNLYGDDWGLLVQDVLPGYFSSSYELGDDMADFLPTGTIVKEKTGTDYYYIENGLKRKVTSLSVLNLNNISLSQALEVDDLSAYKEGAPVSYKESELTECHYKYKYQKKENGNSTSTDGVISEEDNQPTQTADIDLTINKNIAYIYPYFSDSILIDVVLYDETGVCIPYTEIHAYATEQEQIEDVITTAGGSYCGRALFVYRPTTAGEHSINFSAVGVSKEINIEVLEYTDNFLEITKLFDEQENLASSTDSIKLAKFKFSNTIPFDMDVSLGSVIVNATSTGFQDDFWLHANTYYGVIDSYLCSTGFCQAEFVLNDYSLSQEEIYNVYFTVDTPALDKEASICIDYAGGQFNTLAGQVPATLLEVTSTCATKL